MTALRRLVRRHDRIALLLIAAVLAIKLLVPSGFMPVAAKDGTIIVQICSGMEMAEKTIRIVIPGLPPQHGDHPPSPNVETPCTFAGLAMPMLAGVDPLLLAIAILFVLAAATRPIPIPPLRVSAHLRPPLRGPPTTA